MHSLIYRHPKLFFFLSFLIIFFRTILSPSILDLLDSHEIAIAKSGLNLIICTLYYILVHMPSRAEQVTNSVFFL